MKMLKILPWFVIVFLLSCTAKKSDEIAFYHWKNNTTLSVVENQYLDALDVKTVYLRFFDIDLNDAKQPYPISVIKSLDTAFKNLEVVPVVFITNHTFQDSSEVIPLVEKVTGLINQMYTHHLDTIPAKIQIDCDWTASTRDNYFRFLKELKKEYQLSTTIRLHQIKFQEKTGVPPADEGSLMVYNIGRLQDTLDNSIFSLTTLKNYLNPQSDYPLPLDVALPLYSWGVLVFPDQQLKLINNLSRKDLPTIDTNYRMINELSYEVIHPHFLKGFFLPAKTIVKVEEIDYQEVLEASRYLKNCNKIPWKKTLLYHLDEVVLEKYTPQQLNQLSE